MKVRSLEEAYHIAYSLYHLEGDKLINHANLKDLAEYLGELVKQASVPHPDQLRIERYNNHRVFCGICKNAKSGSCAKAQRILEGNNEE